MLGLKQDSIDNHNRFIRRAVENKSVWYIAQPNGDLLGFPSNDVEDEDEDNAATVIPFWSDEAYAKRHLKDVLSDHTVLSIDLESFIEGILKDFHQQQILVGTNWDAHLIGLEIDPIDLAKELSVSVCTNFIQKIMENQSVWFILTPEGDLLGCPSNFKLDAEDKDPPLVFPFWSDEASAKLVLDEHFMGHSLQPASPEKFIEVLKGMDGPYLIGINWNVQLIGSEYYPLQLASELEKLI